MKKIIFILLFSLITVVTFAQPQYFKATSISLRILPNGTWSEWLQVDLPVFIDLDRKHIEVATAIPQIFDYTGFESERISGGTVYGSLATDSNYGKVYIQLYLYDDYRCYLKVIYSDMEYQYQLTK